MSAWFSRLRILKQRFFSRHELRRSHELKPSTQADHDLVLQVTARPSLPRLHQWRLIRRILRPEEQRLFLLSAALFCVASGVGLFLVIKPHIASIPSVGGTVSEGLVGSPKLINPAFAPLNDVDRDLSSLIYSGLFRMDANLQPQPDLAERFQWLNDGQTLQITLRSDARFHDHEPVTSDDVVFTYQAVTNPSWHSPLASLFRDVHLIQVDDHTVQFELSRAQPNFLVNLTLGILPAHVWSDVSTANTQLAEANLKPVGSGPYQFTSFTRDSRGTILSYQLQRFDGYYGIKPWIQTWGFRFFPDQLAAENALRGHQIDALAFLPWSAARTFQTTDVRQLNLELPQETVAFLNVKDQILKDEHVRHALGLAVDQSALQTILGTHSQPVAGPFPFLPANTSTQGNLDAARQELTEAGWTLSENDPIRHFQAPAPAIPTRRHKKSLSVPVAPSSTLALRLRLEVPEQPDLIRLADDLRRRWSLLGAQVTVQKHTPELLLRQAVRDRTYQILIWNVLLSPDQNLAPFWHSTNTAKSGYNFSNSQDPAIDAALDQIENATSTGALEAARQILSAAILAHTPALFLTRPTYAYLVSNRIQGTADERIASPAERLLHTAGWYVTTAWRWK